MIAPGVGYCDFIGLFVVADNEAHMGTAFGRSLELAGHFQPLLGIGVLGTFTAALISDFFILRIGIHDPEKGASPVYVSFDRLEFDISREHFFEPCCIADRRQS